MHPVRPVVELVAQLVERLLQFPGRQQPSASYTGGGQERLVGARFVAAHERCASVRLPARSRRVAVAPARLGGVGERAQHARDVAQRRALARVAPRGGGRVRPRSRADASRRAPTGPARGGSRHAGGWPGRPRLGARPRAAASARRRRVRAPARPGRRAGARQAARGPRPRPLHPPRESLGVEALGRECRVRRVACQHRVQVRSHLAEPAQPCEERRGPGERRQRLAPAVAGTGEKRLQDAERGREPRTVVAVPAQQLRRMLEAPRGQEAQKLELGALARLEPAVGLQDHALAEHDGAVRLLLADGAHRREERIGGQRPGELELHAALRVARRPSAQGAEKRARERRVGQREHRRPSSRTRCGSW